MKTKLFLMLILSCSALLRAAMPLTTLSDTTAKFKEYLTNNITLEPLEARYLPSAFGTIFCQVSGATSTLSPEDKDIFQKNAFGIIYEHLESINTTEFLVSDLTSQNSRLLAHLLQSNDLIHFMETMTQKHPNKSWVSLAKSIIDSNNANEFTQQNISIGSRVHLLQVLINHTNIDLYDTYMGQDGPTCLAKDFLLLASQATKVRQRAIAYAIADSFDKENPQHIGWLQELLTICAQKKIKAAFDALVASTEYTEISASQKDAADKKYTPEEFYAVFSTASDLSKQKNSNDQGDFLTNHKIMQGLSLGSGVIFATQLYRFVTKAKNEMLNTNKENNTETEQKIPGYPTCIANYFKTLTNRPFDFINFIVFLGSSGMLIKNNLNT